MKKLLFISLLFLISCNNETSYIVPAGEHYSTIKPTILNSDVIDYSFTTNETWIWDKPDKNGWSKVTGIAWNSNHTNSVRIVYMRLDTIGVLGYYYYSNGVSPQDNPAQKGILDTITIGNTYQGRLGWENGYYFITMNDKHNSFEKSKPKGIRTLSNPYIGGIFTIANDWKTTITWND